MLPPSIKTLNRNARTVLGAAMRRKRGPFAEQLARVKPSLEIPTLPKARTPWGIAMVKNEADILETTVRHLVAQGIDHLLIMDNGSDDETLSLLKALQSELPHLYVGHDRDPAHYQGAKMTLLADAVRRAGATWVIPFDADELWYGASGTVAQTLQSASASICGAQIHNVYPSAGGGYQVDTGMQKLVKVAFRPHPLATVGEGNHSVARPGELEENLRILHVSWRSYEQFSGKLRNGAKAMEKTDLPESAGDHWRTGGTLGDQGLRAHWAKLEAGNLPELGWTPIGHLIPLKPWPSTWVEPT